MLHAAVLAAFASASMAAAAAPGGSSTPVTPSTSSASSVTTAKPAPVTTVTTAKPAVSVTTENSSQPPAAASSSASSSAAPAANPAANPAKPVQPAPIVKIDRVKENLNALAAFNVTGLSYLQWRAEADDAHERLGDLRLDDTDAGVWVKVRSGALKMANVDADATTVMFGADRKVNLMGKNIWVGGALSFTNGSADLVAQKGKGKGDMTTLAGTVYGQWLSEAGSYVDLSAKLGRLTTEFKLPQVKGDLTSSALAVAVEAGHRFELGSGVFIEPQAAYSYAHIFSGDYDAAGLKVKQSGLDFQVARLGLMTGIANEKLGNVYARVDYLYEFDGKSSTAFGLENRIAKDFGGGWYEAAVGGNLVLTKNMRGWAEVKHAAGGDLTMPWRASVGVRWMF